MKKCKKCNQPVYVYESGFGSQKPYVSALCIDHIYENFAALGILPPFKGIAKSGEVAEQTKGANHV